MSIKAESDYDCIVIGAGVQGSFTAYHLAKKKKKTLLLEQVCDALQRLVNFFFSVQTNYLLVLFYSRGCWSVQGDCVLKACLYLDVTSQFFLFFYDCSLFNSPEMNPARVHFVIHAGLSRVHRIFPLPYMTFFRLNAWTEASIGQVINQLPCLSSRGKKINALLKVNPWMICVDYSIKVGTVV